MTPVSYYKESVGLEDLPAIRHFVERSAAALGADSDIAGDLVLAINEAVANTITHGYQGQPGYIRIVLQRIGDEIRACLYDKAPPFDPTTVPPVDTSVPLQQRAFGGMGVPMMRAFTDELLYRRTAEGENELIMSRRTPQQHVGG